MWLQTTERCLAAAAGFSLPLSTSLTSITLGLLAGCWLLSGQAGARLRQVAACRPLLPAVGLFALYAAGVLYGAAPLSEALRGLGRYRELLLVPLLLPAFENLRTRRWGVRAFEAAMLVTLAASYLMWFGWIESKWGSVENCAVFRNYVTQSILTSFAMFLFARRALEHPKLRWLWILLAVLAAANVLFLLQGRTGWMVLAALTALLLYQWKGLRGLAYAALLLAGVGGLAYTTSNRFQARVDLACRQFSEGLDRKSRAQRIEASVALRCNFYREGLRIARQRPLLGSGPASFRYVYRESAQRAGIPPTTNPHSEYLAALIQAGLPGLGLLVLMFAMHWRAARGLSADWSARLQGVVVTMVVGCLVNSLLLDSTEGTFYGYWTALCLAALPRGTDRP